MKEKKWQQSRGGSLEGLYLPCPGEGEYPARECWMHPCPLPPALCFQGRSLALYFWGRGRREGCVTGDVRR